jgi:hypothetical protein
MTLEQVVAAFEAPAESALVVDPNDLAVCFLSYGPLDTGTHIKLRNSIVTDVQLGAVSFPSHVYGLPSVNGK